MDPAKPSSELLRALTDEHVLRTLMRRTRLTRAELAVETGLSKPTIGDSVRRLTVLGLLADTGERTPGGRGRGRVGSYYSLAPDVGVALAVSIGPAGIVAESVDPYGDVVARTERELGRPAHSDRVAAVLHAVGTEATAGVRPRLAVVSAADPVDRVTGRLVALPDAPFLLGALDPVGILGPLIDGPVIVDNDVNWAARAEGSLAPGRDFAYLYLDEGLGCAIVSDGEVRRGHAGLAGEVAYLLTIGPQGQAMRLIDVFGELGLRQPDSTAIDVDRLLSGVATAPLRQAVAQAVHGVLAAVVSLTDPEHVVIGGSWGTHPTVLASISAAFAGFPRQVPVRAAELTAEPSLAGARLDALDRLRAALIATAQAPER